MKGRFEFLYKVALDCTFNPYEHVHTKHMVPDDALFLKILIDMGWIYYTSWKSQVQIDARQLEKGESLKAYGGDVNDERQFCIVGDEDFMELFDPIYTELTRYY